MEIEAPQVSLIGPGALTLAGKIAGATSAGQVFTNKSTIQGSGAIGQGADLNFINSETGVVDANASHVLNLFTGANVIENNDGVIETTGSGGLNIYSPMLDDGQCARREAARCKSPPPQCRASAPSRSPSAPRRS